ncbi:MAG: glycosyltransferase family 39 protein [Candidatus Saccharimonas sp.]
MQKRVTDYVLYRWRYALSYLFIAGVIGLVLFVASIYVPGALRAGETTASLKSGALSIEALSPHMVIDLPYHILQRFSFMLFGVTTLSIKLPSILLGIVTVFGIFLLVRTWFRRNIAILVTLLAATSTQFLFLVQDGTPNIMFSFLTVWLLFAATYVTRNKTFGTFWKVLTGVLMATALYSPLGIYLVLAVLTTTFFHPHIRYVILHFSRPRLWIGVLLGLASLVPLFYAAFVDPTTLMILAGLPTTDPDLSKNMTDIVLNLFGFAASSTSYLLRPAYSLGLTLLMLVGIYKLVTYKYTARSYITLTLGLFMVPLVLLNPEHVYALFPLACLMIALGIATLITDWYKLFPRNPYARVAGLLPLGVLILGIVYSGITRYMGNYTYNPAIMSHYSHDLSLLASQLQSTPAKQQPVALVVGKDEAAFYGLVAHYDKRFAIAGTDSTHSSPVTMVSHAAHAEYTAAKEPTAIITNSMSQASDRFYIYKTVAK